MYGEPSFMFTSFAQYVLLSPTYINVLNIYAFVTFTMSVGGQKGLNKPKIWGQQNLSVRILMNW